MPPLEEHPDACFVEDCAVVLDRVAVIGVPGAASRRGEVDSVAEALAPRRELLRMALPTTLDGGDVVRADDVLYVGWSSRTNHAGLRALAHLLLPYGYGVKAVEVRGCLHLKSACTYLGADVLLAHRPFANLERVRGVRILDVHPEEPFAATALRVGDTIVLDARGPRTADRVAAEGFAVRTLDIGEFSKAEAGLTCLSLLVEQTPPE